MPIKAKKFVELVELAQAVKSRVKGIMPALEFKEEVKVPQDRSKMSYFLVQKESDYLTDNKKI
jgi:hypothetical protein